MSFDVTRDALPGGVLAIEASAGTGKTWTLSHLVVRLLLTDPALELRRILVVTFTNAAADELAARIRGVLAACRAAANGLAGATPAATALVGLGDAALGGRAAVQQRLEACLAGLDELPVGTIHACCKRILEGSAFACGEAFSAELAPDDGELVAAAVRDAWRARLWSDAQLARLAAGWQIDQDIELWQRWNRHAGTRIEPELRLDAILAEVADAVAEVRAAATEAACAALITWKWKSKHDAKPDLEHLRTGGDPLDAPDRLTSLAGDPAERVYKQHVLAAQGHPLLVACRRLAERTALVRVAWLGWLCPAVAERLRAGQAAAGLWTQDDLLRRVRAALEANPGLAATVRARWPVALIDEFQDTDPVQWEVFRRCHAEGGRLVVVGDPKQAVYRFRGADLDAYLAAVAQVPSVRLAVNYRSDPRLVQAVQALIGRTSAPFLSPRIALPPVAGVPDPERPGLSDGSAPLIVLQPDPRVPADREAAVASEIVHLLRSVRLGDRPVAPRDCAVLARSSAQARRMHAVLRARGVPATLAANGDVLDSPAAAELRAVLTALARPRDGNALRLALATRAWGCDAAAIAAVAADDRAWQRLVEQVEAHHQRWLRHGLTAAVDGWASATGAMGRFAGLPDGERWLTDWRHAVEVLHGEASTARLRPAALLAWWDRRGAESAESRRLRLEGDASAVRILTMHVAKGLEFPIVFCPYIGTTSDRKEEGELVCDAAGPRLVLAGPGLAPAAAAVQAEDDAEQLRLAYVALTRARVRAYVLWGMWDRSGFYHLPLQSALGWWLRPVGQDHAAWRASSAKGIDSSIRAQLLFATCDRLIGLQDAGAAILLRSARCDDQRWQEPQPAIDGDGLRRLRPEVRAGLDAPRMVTSFTGLTGGDAAPERRRGDEPQLPVAAEPAPPSGLRALARGADVGDALHQALETWDFASDPTALVEAALAPLGLCASGPRQPHADAPVAAVAAGLQALASLPIACAGRELLLGALPARLRRAEWEFHLPLARVRPGRVLDLIAAHAAVPPAILADLPRLRDTAPAGGFLKGFVDLLAGDGEAWWVLDWKSNHLGDRPEDYAAERLWPAMTGHGYLVQALLYLLALHRHLHHRLGAAYSYDRHVAGAAWIFLRGVDAGHGVWTWKPPAALVEALDRELIGTAP